MATFKTKADVADNGSLTIVGLPFKSGERVEVTIRPLDEDLEKRDRYPMRGKPYRYDRPFGDVALDDWGIQDRKEANIIVIGLRMERVNRSLGDSPGWSKSKID